MDHQFNVSICPQHKRSTLESYKKSICSYPNEYSIHVLLLSKFKIYKYYQRRIYFTFLNLKLHLPLRVFNRKIHYKLKYFFNFPIFYNKKKILQTSQKKFGFKIYKNSEKKKNISDLFKIGFINEFELSNETGDNFIIFGKDKYPDNKINYEFCDNSV